MQYACLQSWEGSEQWWAKWRLSTFDLYPWGEGHGVQGQICDILRPQLAMNRFLPLWPTDSHTLDTYMRGEGAWGGSDIRSMSSIQPICKCRCPPLDRRLSTYSRHRIYQSTLFVQDNVLSFDERHVMAFCRSSSFTTAVQRRIVGWECRRRGLLLQPGFLILLYFPAVGCWMLVVGWWFRLSVIQ